LESFWREVCSGRTFKLEEIETDNNEEIIREYSDMGKKWQLVKLPQESSRGKKVSSRVLKKTTSSTDQSEAELWCRLPKKRGGWEEGPSPQKRKGRKKQRLVKFKGLGDDTMRCSRDIERLGCKKKTGEEGLTRTQYELL